MTAYVQEVSQAKNSAETESHLIVRNNKGQDWRFASTPGSWIDIGWSPAGHRFFAIELVHENDQPVTPDFYPGTSRLYDIHVFLLGLGNNRVLETYRLSHWQGRISSGTWWDEHSLELVAKQGESAVNQRFRFPWAHNDWTL